MSLETASYIANLVVTNPDGADQSNTADDHLRLIKACLKRSLPLVDGAVSLSQAQFMFLNDLSRSVQFQLNTLRDGSATANNALFANSASLATNANHAISASEATLALTANSASYAALAGTASLASVATLASTANSASYAALAGQATSASFASVAAFASLAALATLASAANLATLATTATSASSAALLGGAAPDDAATASTIVRRSVFADVFGRYYVGNSSVETVSVGHLVVITETDGIHRIVTAAHAGQYIAGQNITGRTGTAKTLGSGTGPPSLSGSTNGDMWLYY